MYTQVAAYFFLLHISTNAIQLKLHEAYKICETNQSESSCGQSVMIGSSLKT